MRSIKFFIICCCLVSCAKAPNYKKTPINRPSDDATIKLAEAASSISKSMIETARIEKVIVPKKFDNTLSIPNTYNLQVRASVDWSGPIEEIVATISKAAHYKLRVIGRKSPVPILISLSAKNESLATILRNIDYQAKNNAHIYVFPQKQTVELRYEKM